MPIYFRPRLSQEMNISFFLFFFLFALLSFVRFVSVGVFKRRMCNNYQDLVIKA